jgi:zinc-ribbon domain
MSTQHYGTARTYAFIGFIFYVLAAAAGVLGLLVLAFVFSAIRSTGGVTSPGNIVTFPFLSVISLTFLFLFIPAIVLAFFAWSTVKSIDAGRYGQARTNSLILGIVGLIFGVFIGGIFFLLAYANLSEPRPTPYPPQAPAQRFCVHCGNPVPPNSRYCPNCGKEQPP